MAQACTFLLRTQPRARWMRFDTAQLLKRFFFCPRSLLVCMLARLPAIAAHAINTRPVCLVVNRLSDVGGVGVAPSASAPAAGPLSGSKTYAMPAHPARDPRFWPCRFYWPDIMDPNYPYGEGMC